MSEPKRLAPRGVAFDYGDTLMGFAFDEGVVTEVYERIRTRLVQELGPELAVPAAAELVLAISKRVDEAVNESYRKGSLEEIDILDAYRAAYRQVGLELHDPLLMELMDAEHLAWHTIAKPAAALHDTLGELVGLGLRLGVVSNASFHADHMLARLRETGVADLFVPEATIYSSAVGVRKPDPRIYKRMLSGIALDPSEVVFVGDRVREDVRGPKSLGMRGVLTREFRDEEDPAGEADAVIASLPELLEVVRSWS